MKGRSRILVVGIVMGVLVLLLYMLLIRPRQSELGDLRSQVTTQDQTTAALDLELDRLRALQENAPELEAELAAIRGLVPRKNQVANFIFQVQAAADEAGVDFVDITPELPKPPPEGAALAEIRMTIGAGGGFFSIQDFLRRLYELDRAFRIDLVNVARSDLPDDVTVDVDLTARIFFELPSSGANPSANTQPVPTETATPAPGETSPAPEGTPTENTTS